MVSCTSLADSEFAAPYRLKERHEGPQLRTDVRIVERGVDGGGQLLLERFVRVEPVGRVPGLAGSLGGVLLQAFL